MTVPRAPRPRAVIHRGVVEASAVLVDAVLLGETEARRRVIALWSSGAVVHRAFGRLLVVFTTARWMDCATAVGSPLVRAGQVLISAPLTAREIDVLAAPAGAAVVVREGAATVHVPTAADLEDPASYLDLASFVAIEVKSLGASPAAIPVALVPTERKARELLGLPPPSAELAPMLAAMRNAPQTAMTRTSKGVASGVPLALLAGLVAALAAVVTRFMGSLPAAAGSANASAGRATGTTSQLAAIPEGPAGPSLSDRLSARLRTWLAQALVRARLAPLLGRRQADYLGRMLEMFDRGDFEQALRHAVPLGGEGPDAGAKVSSPALGVPVARADLSLSLGPQATSRTSLLMAGDLYNHLRVQYRTAFERLEREGRIDEAAFVLAELLRADAEAVAFLERHGRLHVAAELSETRRLSPEVQVRQWFLAGNTSRAVALARRHGAFADALIRLEKGGPGFENAALSLRILWAETLAKAGDFAAAVDVAWSVEPARPLITTWIEAGIAQGGSAGARLLARKLGAFPEAFTEVRTAVLELMRAGDHATVLDRRAFAEALNARVAESKDCFETRTLARPTLRALLRDGAGGDPLARGIITHLTVVANDGPLRADLPSWPNNAPRPMLATLETSKRFDFALSDAGTMPVLDAACLPAGRTVLALGEAGVRVVGRDGRTLFHLDQPVHRLVISDRGDRAIGLAPRGDAVRLTRIDLLARRAESWCEASALDAWASDFDGAEWVVAKDGKVLVIDALESRFAALSSFEIEENDRVLSVARSSRSCAVATRRGVSRFDLPSWTLRARRPFTPFSLVDAPTRIAVAALSGAVVSVAVPGGDEILPIVGHHSADGATYRTCDDVPAAEAWPNSVAMDDAWVVCAARLDASMVVRVMDTVSLRSRMVVTLEGATHASLRLAGQALTVADDRGRTLTVDLDHGDLTRKLLS